jgi:NAD(P)-dependent dehydrogenase (short-subunit alcohol dehydrogenase family)
MIILIGASSEIGRSFFSQPHMDHFCLKGHKLIIGTYMNNKHPYFPSFIDNENNMVEVQWNQLDLTDENHIEKLCKNWINQCSANEKIILIHCAGISINNYVPKTTVIDWDRTFDINVRSAFLLSKYLLPKMRELNYGRIIFLSSVVPQIGVAGTSAYASSKAALKGLTKTIAKENATKNITCNCINLGYMDGGMTYKLSDEQIIDIVNTIPMKKLGDLKNIQYAINFLINADYVTGSSIDINGGLF